MRITTTTPVYFGENTESPKNKKPKKFKPKIFKLDGQLFITTQNISPEAAGRDGGKIVNQILKKVGGWLTPSGLTQVTHTKDGGKTHTCVTSLREEKIKKLKNKVL